MEIGDLKKALPEVWFDWYARLIPGCLGIILYIWLREIPFNFDLKIIFLLVFLGYIIGHILQPISSGIIKLLYKEKLKPRSNRIVSKAYAETISMVSCTIIVLILFVYLIIYEMNLFFNHWIIVVLLLLVFIISTFLRAKATKEKINDLKSAPESDTKDE